MVLGLRRFARFALALLGALISVLLAPAVSAASLVTNCRTRVAERSRG